MLTEEQVRAVLTYEELIPAMRQALMDFSAGRVRQPLRNIIPAPEYGGWFGVMPAVYGTVMGAKMVAFYPGNAHLGKHTHMAMIQLFRADTGEPLVTMDGRLITEMRTAAVSAVAIDHLASRRPRCLPFWAAGCRLVPISAHFAVFASLQTYRVWSRTQEHAQEFAGEIGARVMSARAGGLRSGCSAGADQFAGADPPREMAKPTCHGLCHRRGDPGTARIGYRDHARRGGCRITRGGTERSGRHCACSGASECRDW